VHDPQVWYQIFAAVRDRNVLDQPPVTRLDNLPIKIRTKQRAALAARSSPIMTTSTVADFVEERAEQSIQKPRVWSSRPRRTPAARPCP